MHPGNPISIQDVLAEEYRSLRPGTGFVADGLSDLRQEVHKQVQPFSALCISGGGIRSATFSLGVIQGLSERGILQQFDYLSTVSGGGYIGSWLSAWKQRQRGLAGVVSALRRDAPTPPPGQPDPLQHLRDYNNYLTPKLGLMSADTWTVASTVLRNMILNWLVLVPLLMFVLMAPRLWLALARIGNSLDKVFGGSESMAYTLVENFIPIASAVLFATTIFNAMRYLPSVGNRPHTQGQFLRWCLLPLVAAALALSASDNALDLQEALLWATGSALSGWLAYLLFCGKSVLDRLRLLAGPVTLAVVVTGLSTGCAAWLLVSKLYQETTWPMYVAVAAPLLLLGFSLAGTLFVGFSSTALKDEDREWVSRGGAWLLLFILGWGGLCVLVLMAPQWAFHWNIWGQSLMGGAGAVSGWISALSGFSAKTKAKAGKDQPSMSPLVDLAGKFGAAVFLVVFLLALSVLTNWLLDATGLTTAAWWDHEKLIQETGGIATLAVALGFFAFGWVMAYFININKFSLHAMYRNRLIRAYLGASNDHRRASPFTGFAENDNLQMSDLDTGLKPFHVVNTTLNLVAGNRLAWQQRKAQSFTISPLHCGNSDLGYRTSSLYGGPKGISLGTAVAISGAAASPNMGYHSSPVMGFIMTLFNARLGAWLGNPGQAGVKTFKQAGPTSAVKSLVEEAFGLTGNTSSYVYLSDGGHFENLALYEMVMRRCRYIVVIDAGCDPESGYEDLGNALRKIRIDMRIPITFDPAEFGPKADPRKRCAIGRIQYAAADGNCEPGWLLYIKPMCLGNEPPDVVSYHNANPTFPHQSTGDQWFNESQTESYRMLGLHTVDEMCRDWSDQPLPDLMPFIRKSYLRVEADPAR